MVETVKKITRELEVKQPKLHEYFNGYKEFIFF